MKGWEILAHSVRLVFNNLDHALKISLVPYAISALALLFLGMPAMRVLETRDPQAIIDAGAGLWIGQAIYLLVSIIVALWIAVAWHRYVLLEEYPKGWMPELHSGPMRAYFFRGILIALLVLGVVLLVTLIVGLVALPFGDIGEAIVAVVGLGVGAYLFYRLCPILPAAAVGEQMEIGQAWEATRGHDNTIAVLVTLVIVASFLIQIPATMGGGSTTLGIIYSLVVNWITTLIGVSVLTTFYGHFIENRPID
jgi:hypothetical protein